MFVFFKIISLSLYPFLSTSARFLSVCLSLLYYCDFNPVIVTNSLFLFE